MQASKIWLDTLDATLPAAWREPVRQLVDSVLAPDRPLRVALVGAFTAGKSSLVNMLTGGDWLPAALEETTALPTFVEYGAAPRMQVIDVDGSPRDLCADQFAVAVRRAPPNAAYASLFLDQDWLAGAVLVDLPGLGGMSQANREYALAQIQQADAVLYLIPPRGPDAGDMAVLSRIRSMGKRVAVFATRWDEVEQAAARGEKMVDLQAWETQIEAGSQLRIEITPVSKNGMGRDAVIRYVSEARDALADIRLQRIRAELGPLLDNALGENALLQAACKSDSEEARQAMRSDLVRRKGALTDLKASLHGQADADRAETAARAKALTERHGDALCKELSALGTSVEEDAQWAVFVATGTETQHCALDALAQDMQALSATYGELKIPASQQREFQLHLPPPLPLDSEAFLHAGQMAVLQRALEEKLQEQAQLEQTLGESEVADCDPHRQSLLLATREREALSNQALPEVMQSVGNNNGALAGRFLGELADIGLMFVNPTVAGAKVAALIGKGAKLAKLSVDAAKVAKTATKTFKVIRTAKVGGKMAGVHPSVMEKLGMLEAISCGYWFERFGSALDGPQEVRVVDPDAYEQQQSDLHAIDERIASLRGEISRINRLSEANKLTGWALEQNRKEQALLKADLDEATASSEQQARELAAWQVKDRALLRARYVEQALAHWRTSYERQGEAMVEVLRTLVRHHWEDRVDALVGERLADIAALSSAVDAAPAEQRAKLAALLAEADGLRAGLKMLSTCR